MDISSRGLTGQNVRSRVLLEVRHANAFALNLFMVAMNAWVLVTKRGIALWLNVPVIRDLFMLDLVINYKFLI